MSNERVEISLIGAATYGTLSTVFQKGTPHAVTQAVWASLKDEVNPSTGATLFCLTSDLPPEPIKESNDISTADLRTSGLLGEIDTGAQAVENHLKDMVGDTSSEAPELDEDEFPKGAPDEETDLDATTSTPSAEDGPQAGSDPSTGAPDPAAAPRKLTIGKASKAVQV